MTTHIWVYALEMSTQETDLLTTYIENFPTYTVFWIRVKDRSALWWLESSAHGMRCASSHLWQYDFGYDTFLCAICCQMRICNHMQDSWEFPTRILQAGQVSMHACSAWHSADRPARLHIAVHRQPALSSWHALSALP